MADFVSQPATLREIPGVARIEQVGGRYANVTDLKTGAVSKACCIVEAAEILSNPVHHLRRILGPAMARVESGEIAAVVLGPIKGKAAQIILTAEQYAAGAQERARFAAWQAGVSAASAERQAAERAYDAAHNEGGEGYNPHRVGRSERTYARQPRRDRDYPEGA